MNKQIGFIGLGAMGLPMAKRLCEAGYSLNIIQHSRKEPVEELKRLGANVKSSVLSLVKESDIIITILPADREMEQVLLARETIQSLRNGTILIEMTSGSPSMMKRVADAYTHEGCRVLDAPVSGGTIGAKNGTLTVMAGGDKSIISDVSNILAVMAKTVIWVGKVGDGKAIKAINQMLAGIHMIAASEAVHLAESMGIEFEHLTEVIEKSSGASWMFLNKVDSLVRKDFEPGFKLNLMKKDIEIALNEGRDIALPMTNLTRELYQVLSKHFGDMDFSAVSKLSD